MLDRKLYFVQVCRAAQGNAKCWGLQGHQAYTYQLVSPRIHNTAESELLCVSKHVVSALHLSAGSSFQYTSAWLWDRCSNQGECLIKKGNICHKQRRGLWLTYQTAHIAKGWSIYQWACVPQLALQCLESKKVKFTSRIPSLFFLNCESIGFESPGILNEDRQWSVQSMSMWRILLNDHGPNAVKAAEQTSNWECCNQSMVLVSFNCGIKEE